jgi:hypothetical protein
MDPAAVGTDDLSTPNEARDIMQIEAQYAAEVADAQKLIDLAKRHADNGAVMATSAKFCIADAEHVLASGCPNVAGRRALRSLSYSVGIFHADYKAGAALVR